MDISDFFRNKHIILSTNVQSLRMIMLLKQVLYHFALPLLMSPNMVRATYPYDCEAFERISLIKQ